MAHSVLCTRPIILRSCHLFQTSHLSTNTSLTIIISTTISAVVVVAIVNEIKEKNLEVYNGV